MYFILYPKLHQSNILNTTIFTWNNPKEYYVENRKDNELDVFKAVDAKPSINT